VPRAHLANGLFNFNPLLLSHVRGSTDPRSNPPDSIENCAFIDLHKPKEPLRR
jgi:hypothetical protein